MGKGNDMANQGAKDATNDDPSSLPYLTQIEEDTYIALFDLCKAQVEMKDHHW